MTSKQHDILIVFQVKVIALVKEWNDECNTIDVSYPQFYPYNYGKDVCIGFDPNGHCNGPIDGNRFILWEVEDYFCKEFIDLKFFQKDNQIHDIIWKN